MLTDLRRAFRHLIVHRGITVAAVLSLAIGIGATATTFGWVDQMMLRPLPGVRDTRNLFVLLSRSAAGTPGNVSYPDYVDIRAALGGDADVAATNFAELTLSDMRTGPAELVFGELVSDNYFETLDAAVVLGRVFQGTETSVPAAHPVAILSHHLWTERFDGNPGILGQTVFFNQQPFTIVGVMNQEFRGGFVATETDLWVPLMMQRALVPNANLLAARERRWLQGFVRVGRHGIGTNVRARVDAISRRLTNDHAAIHRGRTFFVTPLWQSPVGIQSLLRPVLLPLTGLAALLLLLACANVANLLLAHALLRRRDLAIRLALGAGRSRAVSQFIFEGLLLAVAGGLVGLLLTRWAIELLRLFQPPTPFTIGIDTTLDQTVVQFAALVVFVVGSVAGLIPAIQSLRLATMGVLKSESLSVTAGRSRRRLADLLAAVQIAVCFAVLIGCGLSVRSLDRVRRFDLGFRPANMMLADYNLFPAQYSEEAGIAFHRRLLQRVSAISGVSSASLATSVPFGLSGQSTVQIDVDGYTPHPNEETVIRSNVVAPQYFRTMAIPLEAGREFEEGDGKGSPLVAIVSHAVATRYWPNGDPLGKRTRLATGEMVRVVGVASDVRYDTLRSESPLVVYLPLLQWYRPAMTLHVRTQTSGSIVSAVRRILQELDASVALFNVTTLATQVEASTFFQRFAASLSVALALVCLVLTAIGVYSLLAYAVAERTSEISLRVALGAQQRDIVGMILRHAVVVAATGLGLGLFGGSITAFLLSGQLVGIVGTDALTWIAGTIVVASIVAGASAVAATRATRIGPIAAIRGSAQA